MKTVNLTLENLLRPKTSKKRAPVLGGRELDVMKILWRDGQLSAQEVLQACEDSDLSLSTIQSTLERLYRKELITRQKTGRYYLYRATLSRSAVISQLLGDIAEQFSEGDMSPMISGFMAFIDQEGTEEDSTAVADSLLKAQQSRIDNSNDDD